MRNFIFISLLIVAIPIVESCCHIEEFCFEVTTILTSNYDVENDQVLSKDSINSKSYAIQINSIAEEVLCLLNFNFGASLNAIGCDPDYYTLSDKLENISIISDADLSEEFPKGSELNTLFYPLEIREATDEKEVCRNGKCRIDWRINADFDELEEFFNNSIAYDNYYSSVGGIINDRRKLFKLEFPHAIKGNRHQFTLDFLFSSGKKIRAKTKTIIFK
ncbi:MAG: hypothetical protein AAGG68_05285 [Bacteroidota bacterium]